MKLKLKDIKKYNTLSNKKPIMVRVGNNWYTWLEGDKSGVFLTTQSGRDIEFDFKQIDDIQENVMKITKTQLRKIIREELLNEKSITSPTAKDLKIMKDASKIISQFNKSLDKLGLVWAGNYIETKKDVGDHYKKGDTVIRMR